MAKISRSNFPELLTPVHVKICGLGYKEKEKQYPKVFTVGKMRKKEETYPHVGGFGAWQENTEGNTINEDEMTEGPTATFIARRFDKGYTVTWELVKDDLYGVFQGKGVKGDARGLGRGLRRTEEEDAASVLNNGFSATGYDGVALFSASHSLEDSSLLNDNLITGALTPANVKTGRTKVRNTLDGAGNKIQAVARQLFTGPDLEFTAQEIVKSQNQAHEQSNTKNVNESLTALVLDYIEGDSWFLRDPSYDNLAFLVRESEWFDGERLPKSVDMFVFGFKRWDCGYYDYRGLAGSAGA